MRSDAIAWARGDQQAKEDPGIRGNITVALLISCALALLGSCGPPTLSQKIDMYLWEKYDALTFSGSVLVALDGKIILRKGYGMADHERGLLNTPETKHRICSISKVFTSLAIMTLCEQGLVTLEDTVDRFYNGFPNGESITLRHLMDHTSGLYDIHNEDPAFDQVARHAKSLDELIATFRDKPLKWIPGSACGCTTQVIYCWQALSKKPPESPMGTT